MFTDGRSKKVVFIAHCLLNQNAISDGTAIYPATFKDVIELFINAEVGIVQLPCPELCCLGIDRGNKNGANEDVVKENTRIRKEMQKDDKYKKLQLLVDYVMQQILEYNKYGFKIVGIIGANRSPNCGVDTTSDNDEEINGKGLFISELYEKLVKENLSIPMIGLKGTDDCMMKITALL
ncbi:hypothetical protein QEW_2162 [Clostridioides difficile CD160]|nr:hypothetical protein QEW_2162 [Clostridioides difficile CD160]